MEKPHCVKILAGYLEPCKGQIFAGWQAIAAKRLLSGADDLAASGKDCESQTENGKNFV